MSSTGAGVPATMKALVKSEEGVSYEYKEVPVPAPVGDELLVKVRKVALCGSDISLYQWNTGEESLRCFAGIARLIVHFIKI